MEDAGFKDVQTEPHLQPMPEHLKRKKKDGSTKETDSDEARLDISTRGFWRPLQKTFFDVRVFDPVAPSYLAKSLEKAKEQNERGKKNDYGTRVREVEKSSFTPLVFTTSGGCAKECSVALKRLAEKHAKKHNEDLAKTTTHIRTTISFTILRANTICLTGTRQPSGTKQRHRVRETGEALDSAIACAEARL